MFQQCQQFLVIKQMIPLPQFDEDALIYFILVLIPTTYHLLKKQTQTQNLSDFGWGTWMVQSQIKCIALTYYCTLNRFTLTNLQEKINFLMGYVNLLQISNKNFIFCQLFYAKIGIKYYRELIFEDRRILSIIVIMGVVDLEDEIFILLLELLLQMIIILSYLWHIFIRS